MITRILTIFCLAFCTMLRAASLPVSFNTTTHKIAAPLDLWTVNSTDIYNGLGLAGMSLQSPSSVSITGGSISGIIDLAIADGGTGASTAAGARTNLGLTIGADVQAYSLRLGNLSSLTGGADLLPYFSGTSTWATTSLTTFGRSLIDDTDAATARTTLGLGGAATLSVGTTAGTVAAGDDSRITGAAQKASNLSDLANAATARSNIGAASTSGTLAQFGATTSAQLFGNITDETGGGGVLVGSVNPTLTTPTVIGTTSTDGPTLGSEFLGASGWTSTDWTGSFASGWTHTTGNTTALTQSTAAGVSARYQITYTVTGRTAGTFDISFGGVSNTALSATGSWGPTTTSTASLSITPTSTFDGTIVLSIKAITTPSSPNIALKSSDGTTRSEWRASSGALGNDFIGNSAGRYTTTGGFNVSLGYNSMLSNTTGTENAALGYVALQNNTTGKDNTALGYASQISNTTGNYNVGVGYASLYNSTTALYNTAVGFVAFYGNITGTHNVAIGANAGRFTAVGSTPLTTASTSVFVGYDTRANADGESNEIVIGYTAIGAGSNTATLGNTSITKTVLRGAVNIGTGPAILTGPAANTLQIGDADSASPSAQTVKFSSVIAGTSNAAGPNATLKAPASTGNAAGGSLKLQVTAPGSSGSTQNTWVDALSLAGDATLTATFSGVVRLKSYKVAGLPAAGTAGRIAYVTDATDPTYRGALTGGGAVTCLVFDNGTSWESH